MASTSWPYSSLRTSWHALVWRRDNNCVHHCTWSYTIKRVFASMWACFWYKAHIEGLVWHYLCDWRLKELKFKVFVSKFRACPNCGCQIHVRKLACPCGHVFRGSKPLTTRNASRKRDVSAARALETEEQTAKHRKSNRGRVVGTRTLETKEQTTKCRRSDAWSILLRVCTGMVNNVQAW